MKGVAKVMSEAKRLQVLKVFLVLFGLLFIFGVHAFMHWFQHHAWVWTPSHSEYEQMIQGIYATLGVFMIVAARNPQRHASLIWFVIMSSLVHGGIMFVQALVDVTDRSNLAGDVPALILVALLLWAFMPNRRFWTTAE